MNNDFNARLSVYNRQNYNDTDFKRRLSVYPYTPTGSMVYSESWMDAISSLMQASYENSISSLNDDNRNDEKEIEILEQAQGAQSNLANLKELFAFYNEEYEKASKEGNTALMGRYKALKDRVNWDIIKTEDVLLKADKIVKSDKGVLSSHNPILEAIGEIFDTTTTGAGIGAAVGGAAGSIVPVAGTVSGSALGGIIGAVSGFGYGMYDYFSSDRDEIDNSAYTTPESTDKIENYTNSIKTRQSYKNFRAKQIQDEQDDLFWWKTEYPVSDIYRQKEQSGSENYLYYNLPGIVGSSFSDTKDMGQQMTSAVGVNKLANKIPNTALRNTMRAIGFVSALRNGWQQSLNENHAEASETSVKKFISQLQNNKPLRDEMLRNAKSTAIDMYGLDPEDANKLIDEEVAFTMYQGGIGGLNPRSLQNSYDYYKAARQLGDIGADTQFERDMIATAGGDILESALMVMPYGALAKKSKRIGLGVAGAAVGAATGEFLGFGVGGSIIGGGIGAVAAQNGYARRTWRNTMKKVQALEDKMLPTLERQIMFDKGMHAASAFGVSALAEAAEEGTQYLNSLDAEKMLSEADDKINLRDMKNLFVNDLKKRGEVFNAVLSQLGLSESPYQTDLEFWSNWKGGLVLGGLMTGTTVSLNEGIGAKRAYNAAKFLREEVLSSAVANRVASQDAILKGTTFAKYGSQGRLEDILDIIERAKNKNKNRTDTGYSDKDFDDLSDQANRIISKLNHKTTKQRLKQLGYELGSDEANYAISVNDYYQQKSLQNAREERQELGEKIKLMNDPNVIEALNILAGEEPMSANDYEDLNSNKFTYKVRKEDGSVGEETISNRDRLLRLHQNAAELISIAQLLKDLQDIQKIHEFARTQGVAFGKNQIDSTISLLKYKYNILKKDVEMYANEQFDSTTTTYDQQIEHLKGYLLDQTSGLKLADLYRNSVLRMLNQRVYTNIVRSLAIDSDVDASNKEVQQKSKLMAKQFSDNVLKNKALLEILDYNIENDSKNAEPEEQELQTGARDTNTEIPNQGDIDQDDGSGEAEVEDEKSWFLKIKDRIKGWFLSDDQQLENLLEDVKDLQDDLDNIEQDVEKTESELKNVGEQIEKLKEDINSLLQLIEEQQGETEQPEVEIIPENVQSVALPQDAEEQQPENVPGDDRNQQLEIISSDVESVAIPSEPENAIIIEDQTEESSVIVDDHDEEAVLNQVDKQQETINMLTASNDSSPRKLMDGWYVTKDGKIIPSDKMYMANPVETPKNKGEELARKYRLTAALIRFNIHRHLLEKGKDGALKLKQYVGKLLGTADSTVIDAVTKAIKNGDQNAVKLLIMQENPIAWQSYYVNEFFRNAARQILNGRSVIRPEYIDKDAFKSFCRQVLLYKASLEHNYGYKFITDITPTITKINDEDVVADPDFIAVDNAGNAHIINVYTINNKAYKQRQDAAETYTIRLGNTKNLFSQDKERSILADIQMQGIKDGNNVLISSASLLPVVVDGYTSINRLYLGKLIPLQPNDDSISKYVNQEDQLLELKELLVKANEKAKQAVADLNENIDRVRKYRVDSKRSGKKLVKKNFTADEEPKSIAEAYAQLDKALLKIQQALKYYSDHVAKEISEMEKFYEQLSKENKKLQVSKEIERINKIKDETQTVGIQVTITDGDSIINNPDLLTKGVLKARLRTAPNGEQFVGYYIEYDGKEYAVRIYVDRSRKYGKKNGDVFKQNTHPIYTEKLKDITKLLVENPSLVLTFDLHRSFIRYAEDSSVAKPRNIIGQDGLLSDTDIENIGVLQDDGKTVNIGFYDEKTGVIQTGSNSQAATLAHAPEGEHWLNKLFLVIKQKHLEEEKTPDRTVSIPLIRHKFDKRLATFIATCYKVVAETNHEAGYDSLAKRELANQLLHLFISKRNVYRKGEPELPNIVYINGESCRINGKEFFILTPQGFNDFVQELQKCEIMPSWDTFNVKFKNLAQSGFSKLYDHFSSTDKALKVSIDGVDSGLEITKELFNNDSLSQWLVRNNFFSSKYFVSRQTVVSMHNIKLVSSIQETVKQEQKQAQQIVAESKPAEQKPADQPIVMSEEEFNKMGFEEVSEDDEEDDDYASPIIPINSDFIKIKNIKTSEDVINAVRTKYPKLAKLLDIAISKIGLPTIHVIASDNEGETAIINSVERQKLGNVIQNKDGSWTITIFKTAKNPIKTLAHETVHIFTLGAINKNTDCARACRVFYLYCKDSFTGDKEKPYGFKSFKEFIAEFFTNDEFREYLMSKDPMDKSVFDIAVKNIPEEQKGRIRTLYDSIVSFISKLWQKYVLRQSPNLYSQIYDTMSKIFGDAYNTRVEGESAEYTTKNHATGEQITLQNCKSRALLRAAIDGIMAAWIKHENITALGKNIDKLNFSTKAIQEKLAENLEFAQWWQRTFTYSDKPLIRELTRIIRPTKDSFKTETNPDGFVLYEKKVKTLITILKKDGTTETKTVKMNKTFTSVSLPNWDLITPVIDEFMADMRIETRKKIQDREFDDEMELRDDGRNVFGELLTESYEIDPFDRASREVKWLFSTVPYGRIVKTKDPQTGNDVLDWEETTDNNEFGMSTFIPFKDVYGKVLYYTASCRSTQDILNKFLLMAHTGPDKAMFLYLYKELSEMIANRWKPIHEKGNKSNPVKNEEGLFFDANVDSTVIKVIRALRQQQNDFVWSYAQDEVDNDKNRYKKIDIRTTLYQKKAIETTKNWKDLLTTGSSDVLKYDTETQTYKFRSGINGNLFQKIYRDLFVGKTSFIYAYNSLRKQDPEDITLDWLYLKDSGNVKFSEISSDDVKMYLHNALLHCGIDISQEILDHWLLQVMNDNPTIKTEMDALYAMLSDQHSKIRPSNFFARLANLSETGQLIDSAITQDTINIAFGSGFVTELANLLNEYDLRTQGLMTVASHNNQYYIVSESNYVSDVKDIINSQDRDDKYIHMLLNDSFAQGSVIVEDMKSDKPIHIDVSTFVGMKTRNIGDQGRDYFEIELDEDIISKLELLHEGYMICPTISDKKTYHVIRGIPLVGMLSGVRSNTQCYYVNPRTGEFTITDSQILDRFIAYFKSERDAVEKAVIAYETKFYKKNPGKKIVNYSDKNALKFSSFCCLPIDGEKKFLNKEISENPRVNLNAADNLFFKRSRSELYKIIQTLLLQRAEEDMNKIVEVGLVKKNEDGTYENVGLDGATILDMADRRIKASFGGNTTLYSNFKDKNGNFKDPKTKMAMSSAVYEYCLDCTIKHLMSMQEYQRLFSGSKAFYKWKAKGDRVTDISVDYTKRRGGDISTGGANIYDIDPLEGMEELGTYRCIEIEDYLVESSTLGQTALIEQFLTSDLVAAAAEILSGDHSSSLSVGYNKYSTLIEQLYKNRDKAEAVISRYYTNNFSKEYADDVISTIKQKAKANAMQYFRKIKNKENPINVADGATYITDRMCERLLREEGKWDDDMKYTFEILRGEHGQDALSKDGQKLYKHVLDAIIGTQKYTATGFRESDDGQGGILMTPYYNKTALFPIFEQIAYGKMQQVLEAMRKNKVDVMMMTSAVKTGSQGAITIDQMLSDQSYTDHTYVQEIRFLRKQLNTDPSEREEMNLGTQTIKIALSNLRMDDEYIDPFTGKTVKGSELYSNIMKCYNILTDIGFEQVMMRFTKRRKDGLPTYKPGFITDYIETDENGQITGVGAIDKYATIPDIDEKALSDFLHEELMSRDANDNMFDAIAHNKEHDRLSAPMSAISLSGWIDSILASYINKTVIDTKSPGAAFIQRSIFCMEGDGFKTINDGKDLKLINDDGSMDAVVSIDFFEKVIPGYNNMTFEDARDWLIKHKLVGEHAKTYTISYRIPTQAQSSINPLKFVDVIPVVKDTIILPKDFTRLTGSDFDIDKLFISRLFINPETVEDEDKMFTFLDNKNWSDKNELLETLRKGFVNKLFLNYMSLLMDKNSHNTKWRPIDADTELWKSVHSDLYPSSSDAIESMQQDTLAYQTEQKNNFVVGKIGIGPYALNNNNHIYTMLYHISVKSDLLVGVGEDKLNMSTLYRGTDIYGNSIMSWLSGGINAHVDIAKDPFVTKLNINKYTYNISNFLIRAGFGRNGLWFLNQPVIKELANRLNKITGEYLKSSTKSRYDAQEEVFEKYKEELSKEIPDDVLNKNVEEDYIVETVDLEMRPINYSTLDIIQSVLGRPLTTRDVLLDRVKISNAIYNSDKIDGDSKSAAQTGLQMIYRRDFEKPYVNDLATCYRYTDEQDTEKLLSMIYNEAKFHKGLENGPLHPSILRYMSVVIFDLINSNEAKIASDVVKYTKIDTKKHGTTIAAQLDYRIAYEKFIANLYSNRPKVYGEVEGLFGIDDETEKDALGFSSSINLNRFTNITDYTGVSDELKQLTQTSLYITSLNSGEDITESNYVNYREGQHRSFINNKTKKAINALTSILRNESVESTYGFEYIWRVIKNDFGKSSLTEDMQSKLRSTILGAIKSQWVFSKMKRLGIDPISLFKDGDNTFSLAHELYRIKTRSIRYVDENHVNRKGEIKPKTIITTVAKVFKDNALLKILHDAHSKDDYSKPEIQTDVLDFIKIHVPFTDDKKKANVYINAWRDLYNNDMTKDFAVKLMFYSFITSNDQGGSNLFKYVPFEMLEDYGLFDAERRMIDILNSPEYLYSDDETVLLEWVRPIVDRVETILCEDFDFSSPYHLESIKTTRDKVTGETEDVPFLEYTGFISVFGKKITKNGRTEKCDRIPYVFIPARINYYGNVSMSKTIVDSYGGVVNRPYIRVYNPVRTYENEERYFIYRRIGEIMIRPGKSIPIYQLVNSSMYTLGEYKIYNYNNEMNISSTKILKTIENYILSENYSMPDIISSINAALKRINSNNDAVALGADIKPSTLFKPLSDVDEHFKQIHEQHKNEVRVHDIRTNLLPKFKDGTFIEFYKNQNGAGKLDTKHDLDFAVKSDLFTDEERSIANQMLTDIKKYDEILELIKAGRKQPNRQVDPTLYHMHSGGAYGADTAWGYYAQQYGIPNDPQHISHYYFGQKTPTGNIALTEEQFFEGRNKVFIADQTLHRFDNMSEERQLQIAPLLARNWMLVKNSDAIFAIGEIKYGKVDGGTGWAVLMAIDAGKPVHVFNLSTEQWFTWDTDKRTWVVEQTPKLTKNFAGIGTRSIDKDIERKTANYKKPVKYVGDQKRQAVINAINDVYRNTFGDPKPKPTQSAVDKAVDVMLRSNPEMGEGTAIGTALAMNSNNNPEFTQGDRNLKDQIGNNPLKVVMASEHTDPAFHSKKVCDAINEDLKKPKGERKYHMLLIMTKHDGLPLLRMLELKIPKSVHFSISSLGGTLYEPGVMKMDDLMDRIEKFISAGKLKPLTTTIRIDPIIPGVTKMEDVSHIMERAAKMGIKSIKVSIMDSYGYNELAKARGVMDNMMRLGYNFDTYYYKYQAKETTYDKRGNVERKAGEWYWSQDAKPEIMADLYQKVDALAQKHGVFCTTCGEKPNTSYQFKKLSFAQGCLNATGVASVLGVKKEDVESATKVGDQRPGKCNCLNCKSDVLAYDDTCNSQCAYCYAKHGSKLAMKYYNEDGTLMDNEFTRTFESEKQGVVRTVQDNGKIRLSLPSHTDEKPRQIVLEPQGDNKYYVHIRVWDGEKVPGKISDEDKQKLYDALYNELPEGAEILLPKSGEGYYGTRGTIAALMRIAKDDRFIPGTKGVVKYEDKDGSIKEYEGTSFIKKSKKQQSVVDPESWSKKEGWSVQYFETKVRPRLNEAWLIEYELIKDDNVNPDFKAGMYYSYGNDKRQDVASDTTFDAVLNGERTSTTRYESDGHIEAWMKLKEGDVVEFYDSKQWALARTVKVRITKAATSLSGKSAPSEKKAINVSSYDSLTRNLSNFAIRPFETELAKGTPKMKMKSVEHAFLSSKAYFAWNRGDITDKQFWDFIKYINAREGKDVKNAGRAIPMSLTTIDEWNKVSDKVLEVMMLRSFLLNETAASQLLNTGNAEFTHNYKNGQPIEPSSPKRFGNLLSKVRSKLRDENNRKQECK